MAAIEGVGTARHAEVERTTQENAYTMKNVVQTATRAQKSHAGCSKRRRTFSHAAQHGLKQLFASIVMIECIWMIDEHDPKICTSRV